MCKRISQEKLLSLMAADEQNPESPFLRVEPNLVCPSHSSQLCFLSLGATTTMSLQRSLWEWEQKKRKERYQRAILCALGVYGLHNAKLLGRHLELACQWVALSFVMGLCHRQSQTLNDGRFNGRGSDKVVVSKTPEIRWCGA